MNLPLQQIRANTPSLERNVHLLAAGAAIVPRQVTEAINAHFALEAELGGYGAADAIDGQSLYTKLARFVGAQPRNMAFTEHATDAWCKAFYALPLTRGQRILTCRSEYAANYVALLHRAKRDGLILECVPSDASGQIDLHALEAMCGPDVGLISLTWVPTNGGLINPAAQVGEIAQAHAIPYLLDACQAAGQLPIDVARLKCDFLSATGRKFMRGPRGTGLLYVADRWLETLEPAMLDHFAAPLQDLNTYEVRPDARRFEGWESSIALRKGLEAALDVIFDLGIEAISARTFTLAERLRTALAAMPGVDIFDLGVARCGIVTFTHAALPDPYAAVAALRAQGIFIGVSSPASSFVDAAHRNLPPLLRVSPHYYNVDEELDRFLDALAALAKSN